VYSNIKTGCLDRAGVSKSLIPDSAPGVVSSGNLLSCKYLNKCLVRESDERRATAGASSNLVRGIFFSQ
jgi:hypothetical protein